MARCMGVVLELLVILITKCQMPALRILSSLAVDRGGLVVFGPVRWAKLSATAEQKFR